MKTHDFINSSIGNKVYVIGDGDLAMSGNLREFIFNKTPLTLVGLSKRGMAVLKDDSGNEYPVPPRNVREYSDLKTTNMTKIESTINYTLNIDPNGKDHSFSADNSIEADIAALLMTERILTIQIEMWTTKKDEVTIGKKDIRRNIQALKNGLNGVRPLINYMLTSYHDFKNYEQEHINQMEAAAKENGEPKEFSDLSNSEQ